MRCDWNTRSFPIIPWSERLWKFRIRKESVVSLFFVVNLTLSSNSVNFADFGNREVEQHGHPYDFVELVMVDVVRLKWLNSTKN